MGVQAIDQIIFPQGTGKDQIVLLPEVFRSTEGKKMIYCLHSH